MRLSRSLHARVAVLLASVLGCASLGIILAGWYYARLTADGAYDTLLRAGAAQIAENTYQQGAMLVADPPVSVLAALSAGDRAGYKVVDPRGVVVAGAGDLELVGLEAERETLRRRGWLLLDGSWRGEAVRIAVTTRRLDTGWAEMAVAQTLHGRTGLARDLAGKAVLAVLVLNGLALGAALLATRRALAPLERVQAALRERDPRDLSPLQAEVPPEIAGVIAALNGFMARLDQRIGMMQRMIGDAAHQLRTPLAALASQIDLLLVEQDAARREAQRQRIAERTGQLGRLAGQLFNHAMVTHRADLAPRAPVDLVALARQALLDLPVSNPAWARHAPTLGLDAPEAPLAIPGDAVSLREALLNLLNNAVQHGAPGRLEVRLRREAGEAVLEVVDDGPGIPPALWPRVRQPFHARPGGQGGAGLGLAIAGEVMRAHGGSLSFRSGGDGFAVLLRFPLPPGEAAPAAEAGPAPGTAAAG